MHTFTTVDSVFDRPLTNLLLILCVLVERSPFTCSCVEGGSLNDFRLGISVGRFSSDGVAASTAVKGLIP